MFLPNNLLDGETFDMTQFIPHAQVTIADFGYPV
jgi:hypothetical protein